MLCYGVYRAAAANRGAKTALATLRSPDTPTQDRIDALDLLDTAHCTLEAHERSVDFIDGLLAALEDKRLEVGLAAAAKAHASATFKRHAMERDTDRDKSRKEKAKAVGEKREQQRRKAIPAARFHLRELHEVVGSKWGGRAGGAGFPGGASDEHRPITWKELKVVRLAVESVLPHLAGRRVLLHEDNQAVYSVLAGLTSRASEMMAELRRLLYMRNNNGVHIRARYIRSAANVWADRLSRHLDNDDWQLDPVTFAELKPQWGAHSVDRFASALSAMLSRYNAAWLDPGCEAVDSLHMSDAEWRRENNYYCTPPLRPPPMAASTG
eukprot:jgi/Tetstr1/435589/TSEL_024492.t1